jgi:hypothetical protein
MKTTLFFLRCAEKQLDTKKNPTVRLQGKGEEVVAALFRVRGRGVLPLPSGESKTCIGR